MIQLPQLQRLVDWGSRGGSGDKGTRGQGKLVFPNALCPMPQLSTALDSVLFPLIATMHTAYSVH